MHAGGRVSAVIHDIRYVKLLQVKKIYDIYARIIYIEKNYNIVLTIIE